MLTILAYVHSESADPLPNNRARIYTATAHTLLGSWGRSSPRSSSTPTHHFQTADKAKALARVAYEQLVGPAPEKPLEYVWARDIIRLELKAAGLPEAEAQPLLDDIIRHAELLRWTQEERLRFSHRTFMEFFAARYFLEEGRRDELLNHFRGNPDRFREVVLLYSGLCHNATDNALIVQTLLDADRLNLALAALVDIQTIEPQEAQVVLEQVAAALQRSLDPELVHHLGQLAATSQQPYGEQARTLVRGLVAQAQHGELPAGAMEAVLWAAVRQSAEDFQPLLLANVQRLNLRWVLPALTPKTLVGPQALALCQQVLNRQDLPLDKKLEWLDGLEQAQAVDLLHELAFAPSLPQGLHGPTCLRLLSLSGTPQFALLTEQVRPLPTSDPLGKPLQDRWGWPWPTPNAEQAKQNLLRLIGSAAELGPDTCEPFLASSDIHPRVRFLLAALLQPHSDRPLTEPTASLPVLRALWIWAASNSRARSTWLQFGQLLVSVFMAVMGLTVTGWALASLISWLTRADPLGLPWAVAVYVVTTRTAIGTFNAFRKRDRDYLLSAAIAGWLYIRPATTPPESPASEALRYLAVECVPLLLFSLWLPVPPVFALSWLLASAYTALSHSLNGDGQASHPAFANRYTLSLIKQLRSPLAPPHSFAPTPPKAHSHGQAPQPS